MLLLWGGIPAAHAQDDGLVAIELPDAPSATLAEEPASSGLTQRPWQPLTFPVPASERLPEAAAPQWWKAKPKDVAVANGAREDRNAYHWRGLIWQTVAFNVFENGFRVSADRVMRDTLGAPAFLA